MAQYRTCEYCGAALDPGERCDCPGATTNHRKEKSAPGMQPTKADRSKDSIQRVARKGAACQ